jgi:hypothetical protein
MVVVGGGVVVVVVTTGAWVVVVAGTVMRQPAKISKISSPDRNRAVIRFIGVSSNMF